MLVAYWCLLAALALVYLPTLVSARARMSAEAGYDNSQPRDQQARLEGAARRAVAAHQNGFEAFAPFAAAVLVAGQVQASGRPVHDSLVAGLALGHVVCRLAYVALYVGDKPTLRSAVWTLGFLAILGLFVLPLVAL